VSFSYWRLRYGKKNIALFFATLSEVASYEVCCIYLEMNKRHSIKEMIICYNGKPSRLYTSLFFANLERVKESIAQLRLKSI